MFGNYIAVHSRARRDIAVMLKLGVKGRAQAVVELLKLDELHLQ